MVQLRLLRLAVRFIFVALLECCVTSGHQIQGHCFATNASLDFFTRWLPTKDLSMIFKRVFSQRVEAV